MRLVLLEALVKPARCLGSLEGAEQVLAGPVLRGAGRSIGPEKLAVSEVFGEQENQRGTGAIIELQNVNANTCPGKVAVQAQQIAKPLGQRPGPLLDRGPTGVNQFRTGTVIAAQTSFCYHMKPAGQGLLKHFLPRGPGNERLAAIAVKQVK